MAAVVLTTQLAVASAMMVMSHAQAVLIEREWPYLVGGMAAVVMVVGFVARWARRAEVGRWVPAPIVLLAGYGALMVAAYAIWRHARSQLSFLDELYPLVPHVPAIAGAVSLALVLAALVAPGRGRRTPRWLIDAAVFADVALVVATWWVPIYARFFVSGEPLPRRFDLAMVEPLLVPLVVPIVAIAIVITAIATRMQARPMLTALAPWLVGVAASITIIARAWTPQHTMAHELYEQCIPAFLGLAWVAWSATVALGVAHVGAARRLRARVRRMPREAGVIVVAPPAVAAVHSLRSAGWVTGFETTAAPMVVRVGSEPIVVPSGIEVVAPIPPAIAFVDAATWLPVLADGDPVELVGLPSVPTDSAYRDHARVLGPGAAVIAVETATSRRRDLVLRLWQPSTAFAVAVLFAAVPGLLGWFTR